MSLEICMGFLVLAWRLFELEMDLESFSSDSWLMIIRGH